MIYFVTHYGIWLSAAFAVGILTEMLGGKSDDIENVRRLCKAYFVLAVYLLLFVAFIQVMPGRLALYSESAAAILAAFLVGGGVGAKLGGVSGGHMGRAVGLTCAALIWLAANFDTGRKIEANLKHEAGTVVQRAGGDPLDLDVAGRDVLLPADVEDRASLAARLSRLAGVRLVSGIDQLTGPAAELRDRSLAVAAAARLASSRQRSGGGAARARAAENAGGVPGGERAAAPSKRAQKAHSSGGKVAAIETVVADDTADQPIVWQAPIDPTIATGPVAESPARTRRAAAATAMDKPANGAADFDDGPCHIALSEIAAPEKVHFDFASAAIRPPSARALEKVAEVLKHCPNVKVEIGGHTDSVGQNERNRNLSQQRAQAVADRLGTKGVERDKLIVVGYGASKPVASNDTEDSRARNRRVEFVIE